MIPKAPQRGFPVTADWGRSIVDALRRLRLRAGPGVKITQTPEGTTITVAPDSATPAAPPRPYELRWRFNDTTAKLVLVCYVGVVDAEAEPRQAMPVYLRNGMAVPYASHPDATGWAPVFVDAEGTCYVVARAVDCLWGTETNAKWELAVVPDYPLADDSHIQAKSTPVLIGRISAGAIEQVHTGVIASTYDAVVPARVEGGNAIDGYSVGIYGDGLGQPPTGEGLLFAPELSAYTDTDLPTGSVVLAHRTAVTLTGGTP